MKNIILFGKPGAGKGTQAALLRDAFQLIHISTGDLFRYNISNNTSLGALAKSYMDKDMLEKAKEIIYCRKSFRYRYI